MRSSQLFGAGNSPAIIPGVPIQTGETIAIGDQVALDYQGKAIKVTAPTDLVAYNATTATTYAIRCIVEVSLDKYIIVVAFGSAANSVVLFYNKATNAVTATASLGLHATGICDVRTLPNGEIVILFPDATSVNVAKFTAAGVQVGSTVSAIALASLFSSNPAPCAICPSPVNGEFWFGYYVVTSGDFQAKHYNTSVVLQGTTAAVAATGTGNITSQPTMTAAGGTTVCFTLANRAASTAALVVFNASTRAIVGSAQDLAATVTVPGALSWDATNSQFVLVTQQASADFIVYKMTQAAGTLTNIGAGNSGSGTLVMLTPTTWLHAGGAYTYSTASSGSFTRKLIYASAMDALATASFVSAGNIPNFCYQGQGNQSGGLVAAAWVEVNSFSGKAAYSVNAATGKATGLFTTLALISTTGNSLRRAGARYDIQVYAEKTTVLSADYQIRIKRFDAGVQYGAAKAVQGTLVDIDTQKLGAIGDTALMPVRNRSIVLANDYSHAIGG